MMISSFDMFGFAVSNPIPLDVRVFLKYRGLTKLMLVQNALISCLASAFLFAR